ncbi:SpoIIE family protein phosphatase [candidate division KSB1 bacterium]|nr:SpoIIE family protein phosphatase [candidate division KSB1 bacterium]MBL7094845.1 SpoIIE family protein phosphatase [candidate division KSB1 bacterium]
MLLHLTEKTEEPLHNQISRQLTHKIIEGDLLDGAELDSIRKLATSQRVSINTVKRAYEVLEQDGLIISESGKGFYVASLTPEQKQKNSLQRLWGSHSMLNVVEIFSNEKRRIDEELAMARQIQAGLLPKELPNNEMFSIAAYSSPSKVVGGDFYDYIPIDKNRFGIVIADACGKGIPAAMLISQIQAMIKSELNNGNDIEATLQHLNQQVVSYTPKDKFVTLFFGIYNCGTDEFEYSTAGHEYPIVTRSGGKFERLQSGGPALGIIENVSFVMGKIKLHQGDSIVFFTDGVTETMNPNKEMYGIERLCKLLVKNNCFSPDSMIEKILDDLGKFSVDENGLDDRTFLVMTVNQLSIDN